MDSELDRDINFVLGNDHNYSLDEINKITDAILVCKKYHNNQKRLSGEKFYTHPLSVAQILVLLKMDSDTIITGILHDTVEDTQLTLENISNRFGDNVAKLVNGVTKLMQISYKSENFQQAQNFRKLILEISKDIRVLIIKLADRLHNMRTIENLAKKKKISISLETIEIYAPLAARIGFQQVKQELQDLAFSVLYPSASNSINLKLESLIGLDLSYIEEIKRELYDLLKMSFNNVEIYGRKKSIYSIWMKMQHKNISFEQLSDVFAFRVILDEVTDCYLALGIIHTKYRMVPNNFQDFISIPKNNHYQSLHTVIIGPSQKRIEIQIRTKKMHNVAEFGLAAHWLYKESTYQHDKRYEWVSDLLNIVDQNSDPDDFLNNTKLAMYYDQIFCFTECGKIISLPKSPSILDFAYSIGIETGHRSSGGIINGIFVPNEHILKNGDQVKILTSQSQKPSSDWLNFVMTGKARSAIQNYIFNENNKNINIGRSVVEGILSIHNIDIYRFNLDFVMKYFSKQNLDNLYIDIALEKISETELLSCLRSNNKSIVYMLKIIEDDNIENFLLENYCVSSKILSKFITLNYQRCCRANTKNNLIGLIDNDEFLVHSRLCSKFALKNSENKLVPISLNQNNLQFQLLIKMINYNEKNIISDLLKFLEKNKCTIINMKTQNSYGNYIDIKMEYSASWIKQSVMVLGYLENKSEVDTIQKIIV